MHGALNGLVAFFHRVSFAKSISFIGLFLKIINGVITPLWFTPILRETHSNKIILLCSKAAFFIGVQVYSVMVGYVIYSQRLNKSDDLVTKSLVTNEVTNEVTPLWLFL
jgi:hypothetical protein